MEQKTKTEKEKYQEMREMFYKEIMRMAKMLMKQEENMRLCTMKCTRCKKELIAGKNIYENWHIPICRECRKNMDGGVDPLTPKESRTMERRLKKESK